MPSLNSPIRPRRCYFFYYCLVSRVVSYFWPFNSPSELPQLIVQVVTHHFSDWEKAQVLAHTFPQATQTEIRVNRVNILTSFPCGYIWKPLLKYCTSIFRSVRLFAREKKNVKFVNNHWWLPSHIFLKKLYWSEIITALTQKQISTSMTKQNATTKLICEANDFCKGQLCLRTMFTSCQVSQEPISTFRHFFFILFFVRV